MAVKIIPFAFPTLEYVHCAFQCRVHGALKPNEIPNALSGGNISYVRGDAPEAVRIVRAELAQNLGFSRVAEVCQYQGAVTIFDVPSTSQESTQVLQRADGLATDEIDLALMIKTADCQPLLFAHASGQHLMALHVGWRGNRANYIQQAVARWCAIKKIQAQDIFVVRGPSLGPVQAEFIHFNEEWGSAYKSYFEKTTNTMDLWRLTRDQLLEAGLLDQQIYGLDLCTTSLSKMFFSYRVTHKVGNQASFIWRTS